MFKRRHVYVLLILTGLLATSCGDSLPILIATPSATPVPTVPLPTPTISIEQVRRDYLAQIDGAETRWQMFHITSYEITTLYSPQHFANTQVRHVVVKDGKVAGQRAAITPSPGLPLTMAAATTPDPFHAESYTVPGLFEIARDNVSSYVALWPRAHFGLNFDLV